ARQCRSGVRSCAACARSGRRCYQCGRPTDLLINRRGTHAPTHAIPSNAVGGKESLRSRIARGLIHATLGPQTTWGPKTTKDTKGFCVLRVLRVETGTLLRLRRRTQVRLVGLEYAKLLLRLLVCHRGRNNDVVARLPIRRRGHIVL